MNKDLILSNVELLTKICPMVARVYLENKLYKLSAKDIVEAIETSPHDDLDMLRGKTAEEIKQLMADGVRLLRKPEEGCLYWAKDFTNRTKNVLIDLGYKSYDDLCRDLSDANFHFRSQHNVGDKIDFEVHRYYEQHKPI